MGSDHLLNMVVKAVVQPRQIFLFLEHMPNYSIPRYPPRRFEEKKHDKCLT